MHKRVRRYLLDSTKGEVPGTDGGKATRRERGCGPPANQPPTPREKGSRPSRTAGLARGVSFRHGSWRKVDNKVTPRTGSEDPGRNPTHVASRPPSVRSSRCTSAPPRPTWRGFPERPTSSFGLVSRPLPGPAGRTCVEALHRVSRLHLRRHQPPTIRLPARRKSAWQGPGAAILPWGGSDIKGA